MTLPAGGEDGPAPVQRLPGRTMPQGRVPVAIRPAPTSGSTALHRPACPDEVSAQPTGLLPARSSSSQAGPQATARISRMQALSTPSARRTETPRQAGRVSGDGSGRDPGSPSWSAADGGRRSIVPASGATSPPGRRPGGEGRADGRRRRRCRPPQVWRQSPIERRYSRLTRALSAAVGSWVTSVSTITQPSKPAARSCSTQSAMSTKPRPSSVKMPRSEKVG